MDKLKKATKILSIFDIAFCLLAIVLSLIFPVLVEIPAFSSDDSFDLMLWIVIAFFVLAVISILFFVIMLIVCSVRCKKIIKEKSVIAAHILNVILVALSIVFVDKLDLWFVFA